MRPKVGSWTMSRRRRKRSLTEIVLDEALTLLGLIGNVIKDALHTLEERGIITMHGDCLATDDKEKLQIAKNCLKLLPYSINTMTLTSRPAASSNVQLHTDYLPMQSVQSGFNTIQHSHHNVIITTGIMIYWKEYLN